MSLEFIGSPYIYAFIFLGMLVGGELVLLPSIFFGLLGYLNIWYVFLISIVAVSIADGLWYLLGRRLTKETLFALPFLKKQRDLVLKISALFQQHSSSIIFFAKYMYGIRIIVQIVSGMHRIPFQKYFVINVSAIIFFNILLIVLARIITTSLSQLQDLTRVISIGLTAFVIIVILLHWLASRIIKRNKKWAHFT